MSHTVTLTLVDGSRIVVPDSLDLITPYVLREQEDWFEDEIKFLRRVLQRCEKVVDIGANYGVYTVSMARAVGPAGHVWAFEPASGTASLLAATIKANGYEHVSLEQSALSSATGTAQLSLHPHSELNALTRGAASGSASETVTVLTLDECMQRHDWRDIDFVKIDAEGEEANILRGGARFFAACSPLVQYEIKAGVDLHLELVDAFAAMGYESYRLVPGLDLLVRFETSAPVDGYLLNLFCCKPERAERLAMRGHLVEASSSRPAKRERCLDRVRRGDAYDWHDTAAKLPYVARLGALWERTPGSGESGDVKQALSLYARSRDPAKSAAVRFGALEASFNRFRDLCDRAPSHLRLASFARVAGEIGARALAVNALSQLCTALLERGQADCSEPFLAPGLRFDSVDPGPAPGDWIFAAALEELERLGSYSSFYTGDTARKRLEKIRDLGFGSVEMHRRLNLIEQRYARLLQ